jgi:Tat protein translocase TatB subunit
MICFVSNIITEGGFIGKIGNFKTQTSFSNFQNKPNSFKFETKEGSDKFSRQIFPQIANRKERLQVAVFGPGGGFLGVGTSELVVIVVVAWLVLGPKRLYQLARDIGKISGEIKNVAEEARQTFQQAIDIESGDLSNFSPNQTSQKKKSSIEESKPRLKDLDDLVNQEISNLEKKTKKDN